MKLRYVVTGPDIEPEEAASGGGPRSVGNHVLVRGKFFDTVDAAVDFGRRHAREHPSVVPVMVTEEILLEEADVPMTQLVTAGVPVVRGDGSPVMVPDHRVIQRMLRTRMMWNSQQINDEHVAPPLPASVLHARLAR